MSSTLAAYVPLVNHSLQSSKHSAYQSGSAATGSRQKWITIDGPVQETLLPQLQGMHWAGVKQELIHVLLTLAKWRQPVYSSTVLSDETDSFVHGFDTFMDQVSESARDFAVRYGELNILGLGPASLPSNLLDHRCIY
jgi:hypothetical protein